MWSWLDNLLNKLMGQIYTITDPETGIRLDRTNLIIDSKILKNGKIQIVYSPFSPASPVAVDLGRQIKTVARKSAPEMEIEVICQGHIMDDLINRLLKE